MPILLPHPQRRVTPQTTGTPDPRPLTGYSVECADEGGGTRVSIELAQPCIVRNPKWTFIDCVSGDRVFADDLVVVDSTHFDFVFTSPLPPTVNIIAAPYQDMEVQNYFGGFVVPGGRWFREPVLGG